MVSTDEACARCHGKKTIIAELRVGPCFASGRADEWIVREIVDKKEICSQDRVAAPVIVAAPAAVQDDDDIGAGFDVPDFFSACFSAAAPEVVVEEEVQEDIDPESSGEPLFPLEEDLADIMAQDPASELADLGQDILVSDAVEEHLDALAAAEVVEYAPVPKRHVNVAFVSLDIDKLCSEKGFFEQGSSGTALRFTHRVHPSKMTFCIHAFAKASGRHSFKATCMLNHRSCVCWVTKEVEGEQRNLLLKELVDWGAGGVGIDADEHWRQSRALKASWGMKVR